MGDQPDDVDAGERLPWTLKNGSVISDWRYAFNTDNDRLTLITRRKQH